MKEVQWTAANAELLIRQTDTYMYDRIAQFEPLLPPSSRRDGLIEKAHQLQRLALAAKGRAHASVMLDIGPLLRAMNS